MAMREAMSASNAVPAAPSASSAHSLSAISPLNAVALAAAFSLAGAIGTLHAQAPVTEKSPSAAANTTAKPPATAATTAPPDVASATSVATPAKVFVTMGDKPSVMYDAPSTKANKIFIINALTPLELLVRLDKLTKVRDMEGAIGWIENTSLGERRHVQVSSATAEVHANPAANAPLVFEAQRMVVLEVTGTTTDGWLPVKHRDGQAGFIRLSQVWGD
jgi:SH3-like domain-containing protein